MKIAKNTVVTVEYSLSDTLGNLIEQGQEPMVYLHGGYENTLPKIEEALEGKEVGFNETIQVEPEDAFGEYDADLVKMEERSRLPSPIFTVTEIAEDKVVLDGNHPLAGIALRFALHVTEVREATAEEIAHGHVHGAGAHLDDDDEDGEYRSYPLH
jgi:FKBP-type peptidyl-prolyl cis-trans isomerase SlyD